MKLLADFSFLLLLQFAMNKKVGHPGSHNRVIFKLVKLD